MAAWLRRTPLNKMYSLGEKASMIRALEHGDRSIVDLGKTGKISLEARPEQDRVQMTKENGKQIWRIPTDNDTQRVRRKR